MVPGAVTVKNKKKTPHSNPLPAKPGRGNKTGVTEQVMRKQRTCHAGRNAGRAGIAAVEMALVTPLLFLFIFGLLDIAHGYMVQHLMQDASRQGCRAGVCHHKTNVAVQATVDRLLKSGGIPKASTTILVNNQSGDVATAKPGDSISVQLTLPLSQVSFFPTGGFLKGQLNATCTMRRD